MNRLGRGYSFDALRAKILFAEMCDSFARMTPKVPAEPKPYIRKSTASKKPEKNYGADIATLIHLIENGEL